MVGKDTGVGVVKVDFRRVDDVAWWGKPVGFAQGVEKCGGGCSGLRSGYEKTGRGQLEVVVPCLWGGTLRIQESTKHQNGARSGGRF